MREKTSLWRAAILVGMALYLVLGLTPQPSGAAGDLWVDAQNGNDANNGGTRTTAFRTIQKAANLASPGTTVHILPGIYRETVKPARDGTASAPITYLAEDGPGTVVIRGSVSSSTLDWTQLTTNNIGLPAGVNPTNVYYTDLSAWNLSAAPRFVVALQGENITRLPMAREPDWQVVTEWKHHEFWWAAQGGSSIPTCDPSTDEDIHCDRASRSLRQIIDRANDTEPAGIEPGNLTTVGNLVGATLWVMDTSQGHYSYRRTIVAHDPVAGQVTVDENCEYNGASDPGLGWNSKYYVEGVPSLLDNPGEWWYDQSSGHLYIWPDQAGSPSGMQIEISRLEDGFDISGRSYLTVDGLKIEFFNEVALKQFNTAKQKSYSNHIRRVSLRYANYGLHIVQFVEASQSAANITDGFVFEDSGIGYIDRYGIRLTSRWEGGTNPDRFSRSGLINTTIRNNEMHHLGFRSESTTATGIVLFYCDRLRFENNYVHDVAHIGTQLIGAVNQSDKKYDFDPSEIKTGQILIKDNIFEQACQLGTDCGALKVWGLFPNAHVFRETLLVGNVFRNTYGWTYVAEKRGRWSGGSDSQVHGMGGFGLYVDMASGVHAYRNIAYNNGYAGYMFAGVWRDGDIVFYNNIAANSLYGFRFSSPTYDTHGSVNTQVVNNLLVNNETQGIYIADARDLYLNKTIDHNLYYQNGWQRWDGGALLTSINNSNFHLYETVDEIREATPWEDHGVSGDPVFWDYDVADHNLFDGSWPNFQVAFGSPVVDRGTQDLPASLSALLTLFGIPDVRTGSAYDIGPFEAGFDVTSLPLAQAVDPGGVARFVIQTVPADLPSSVTLQVNSPSGDLQVTLDKTVLSDGVTATLTVRDRHSDSLQEGLWYTIPVLATCEGVTVQVDVTLLVGGTRFYVPMVRKN